MLVHDRVFGPFCVYQGFRLNLGKRSEMIIFGSLLTTFEISSSILWGTRVSSENWLELKNQTTKLFQFNSSLSESLIHTVFCGIKCVLCLNVLIFLTLIVTYLKWNFSGRCLALIVCSTYLDILLRCQLSILAGYTYRETVGKSVPRNDQVQFNLNRRTCK